MYKKFDLEAAKNGAPVITRDGLPARIVCFDRKHECNNLVVLIENSQGIEVVLFFYPDGRYYTDMDNDNDLFMAPVKKKGWVNVYRPSNEVMAASLSNAYTSKEKADVQTSVGRIACVEIEWEE